MVYPCGRPLQMWAESMNRLPSPEILITGTKRSEGSCYPDYTTSIPRGRWVGTDLFPGDGVDLVADLHEIDEDVNNRSRFHGVFSASTLEHVERPWRVIEAFSSILRPGGLLYVHTHQTFPVHLYPSDYWRFTDHALRSLCEAAGLQVVACEYDSPCSIMPPDTVTVWDPTAPAYLNVTAFAMKGA